MASIVGRKRCTVCTLCVILQYADVTSHHTRTFKTRQEDYDSHEIAKILTKLFAGLFTLCPALEVTVAQYNFI